MKKILCLLSLVSLFAAPLEASSWTDSDGVTWYYERLTTSNGSVYDAKVWSVSVPSGVEAITVPTYIDPYNRITQIEASAFSSGSKLTSITIPSSVTSISAATFERCSSLREIIVSEAHPSYKSENGLLLTKTGEKLVRWPNGLTSVTIPSSVTTIGERAFSGCKGLTSVTIPSSVTTIETFTFYNCSSLTSVTIPEGVTSIGTYAFCNCTSLTSVSIPSSVTTIEAATFSGCTGLSTVVISEGVSEIGAGAFNGCLSLSTVIIPSSITSVGSNAFSDSRIEQLWCYTSPNGWATEAFGTVRVTSSPYETRARIDTFRCPEEYKKAWSKYFKDIPSLSIQVIFKSFVSQVEIIPSIFNAGTFSFSNTEIAWGETASITATPKEGYIFLGWSSDVEGIGGSEPTLTFTVPEREEVLLIANFFPKAVLTTLVNETLNATLDAKVDARIDAKIDGEKLLTAEQAATKTSATINQKVADGELITSDQLQVMALSDPVIEVKDGTATVGISVMKASAVDGEWEDVELDADAASVESDKVKVEVPADEKAAFYKFVVPEKQ